MAHRSRWTGNSAAGAPERGFTLIELLVVLVIMGLFVGLVSAITRPDDRALLRLETDRLAQLLELAATESHLTGKSIAWTADDSGYRFWRFSQDTDWSEIRDDDSLRARTLPHGMRITSLRVETTLALDKKRLEFNPYGTTLAFSIETSLGDAYGTVEGSPIGEMRVLPEARKTNDEMPRP